MKYIFSLLLCCSLIQGTVMGATSQSPTPPAKKNNDSQPCHRTRCTITEHITGHDYSRGSGSSFGALHYSVAGSACKRSSGCSLGSNTSHCAGERTEHCRRSIVSVAGPKFSEEAMKFCLLENCFPMQRWSLADMYQRRNSFLISSTV